MGTSSELQFFLRRRWGLRQRMPRPKNRSGQGNLLPLPQRATNVVPFDSLPADVRRKQEVARRAAGDRD